MKLKKTYTISVVHKIAKIIEKIHDTTGKSYTEIFLESFKEKYGDKIK